jgi:predicted DNA-binding transcriptional regulator YafY
MDATKVTVIAETGVCWFRSMDRTERFYKIQRILETARHPIPMRTLTTELGMSQPSVKRDLRYMRDRLNAPIAYDRGRNGYYLEPEASVGPTYALPGLWLSANEIYSLLLIEQLLADLQPGLLQAHLSPLQGRLRKLLGRGEMTADEVRRRIKIVQAVSRPVEPEHFQVVSAATLARKQIALRYHNRYDDQISDRTVSPQRLVYYRANWYVIAWCHWRNALRSFAIDAIQTARIGETSAEDIAEDVLNRHVAGGYGIFSGEAREAAVLRFTPEAARWVSAERWHPLQEQKFDADGYLVLRVPYSVDYEIVMDILRYGSRVEVVAPEALRTRVHDELVRARAKYSDSATPAN